MTTSTLKLTAKPRKIFGRKVKSLRRAGLIPANVFGPKIKSKALTLNKKEFYSLFKQVGETNLVDLVVEGEKKPRKILISNIQLHPVTHSVLHVDLHQVDLKTKTTVSIPVNLSGEAPAVAKGGVVVLSLKEVEVEALPTDLPEKIVIDISNLKEIGDSVLIKDLNLDREKLTLLADPEEIVVSIQAQTKEKEEEKASAEETAEKTADDASKETHPKEEGEGNPTQKEETSN